MALLGTNTVETSSTTGTITTTGAVASGGVVIVSVVWEGTGIPTGISAADSRGNTYTVDASRGAGNATASCAIIRGTITTALQVGDTITVTTTATRTRWILQADSDTGFDASPLDKTAGNDNPGSSSSLSTGTTATTTQANERLYAVYGFGRGSGQNVTGVGGWSSTSQVNTASGTTPRGMQVAYTTVAATGTQQGTATLSAAAVYVAAIVTYKLAATGTPVAGSDSGTLTETAAVEAAVPASDSGTLTEAAALEAAVSASDSGTLSEAAEVAVIGEVSYALNIDWNADGAFTGTGENVMPRALARGGFSASFGRDQARSMSPPASGRAAFQLNNESGDYSPDNTGSPLAGDVLPAREVLATAELNSVTYTLFRGHLDEFEVKHERNARYVDCTALDPLAKLRGAKISTQLHKGIRTGEAIDLILDAVDWPADLRDLDLGATTIRWWWEEDTDAYEALMRVMGSEGPPAIVHADPDGRVVFRDRHHRLLRAASTDVQATITDGDGGYEPAFSAPFSYNHGWKEVINDVSFQVEERDPSVDPETVWESDEVRQIPASTTVTVEARTNDPVIEPELSFDTLAGSVTGAIVQESGQRLTIELTAGGSAAAVANLAVTARAVAVRRTYQIEYEDAASITTYGKRTYPVEAPWAGVNDADAIAQIVVGQRAERLPVVSFRLIGAGVEANTRLEQQLGRDLSDRVHIEEANTGVNGHFFLEQINHRITNGGVLETTFGLERASEAAPANLFLFDVAGAGFDDGVFAT